MYFFRMEALGALEGRQGFNRVESWFGRCATLYKLLTLSELASALIQWGYNVTLAGLSQNRVQTRLD